MACGNLLTTVSLITESSLKTSIDGEFVASDLGIALWSSALAMRLPPDDMGAFPGHWNFGALLEDEEDDEAVFARRLTSCWATPPSFVFAYESVGTTMCPLGDV